MAALAKLVKRMINRWSPAKTPPGAEKYQELPTIPLPKLTVIPPAEKLADASGRSGIEPPA